MVFIRSILTCVLLFHAFSVRGFLLNTNTSNHLLSSGQATGYDANTILYLFKKIDNLQLQIHQQSKTLEAQNKTMETQSKTLEAQNKTMEAQSKTIEAQSKTIEAQSKTLEAQNKTLEAQNKTMEAQTNVIQELMNITKQEPSAVSLSNDLSILQMFVRGMIEENHKLSNVSNATDVLALRINSIARSVRLITSSLIDQGNRMNTTDSEFQQHMNSLNISLISVVNRVLQLEKDITSSLVTHENRMNTMDTEFQQQMTSLNKSLILTVNRVLQKENDIFSNCSTVSSVLTRLETNISDINDRIHELGAFGKLS